MTMQGKEQIDIVPSQRHDIYPRIETRDNGPLNRASQGKVLLITGGSKGVGRSIALFHAYTHPHTIILTARTSKQLESVASEIAAIDAKIKVITASVDVTDVAAVSSFFKHLREAENVGRVDVLFNNAGYLEPPVLLAQQNISDWTRTIQTNIIGVGVVTHYFLRHNFEVVGGSADGTTEGKNKEALKDVSIITTSSVGALRTSPGFSGYQTSKIWANKFTQFIDVEYGASSVFGDEGLRAYCFHPGRILTDLAQNMPSSFLDRWRNGEAESPDLSGGFTAWLLTPEADFLRGRYVSASWDVDDLVSKKHEIVDKDLLKVTVAME